MIPDWKLERYLTGDLPAAEMQEIRQLEKTDEFLAARVRAMRENGDAVLQKFPFESFEAKIESCSGRNDSRATLGSASHSFARFTLMKIAAAMVIALGVIVTVFGGFRETQLGANHAANQDFAAAQNQTEVEQQALTQLAMADVDSDTRIKGMDIRIEAWKKMGDSAVQLNNLADAREGDEIQLRYSVPEKCFGLLFSMDGNGTLTIHMGDGGKAIALEPGKMTTLPFAYKLDNAPKFEKFFLLTSRSEFTIDASDIDATMKNDKIQVASLTLRKVGGNK